MGSQHRHDEDGLVYKTSIVVVNKKGFIIAYRRLITSGDSKPREVATPIIDVAHVARMTEGGCRFSVGGHTCGDQDTIP